jgi:hypothetical protein
MGQFAIAGVDITGLSARSARSAKQSKWDSREMTTPTGPLQAPPLHKDEGWHPSRRALAFARQA